MLLIAGSEALTTTLAVSGSTRSGSGNLIEADRAEPLHNARSVIPLSPTSTRRITAQVRYRT